MSDDYQQVLWVYDVSNSTIRELIDSEIERPSSVLEREMQILQGITMILICQSLE